MKRLLKQLWDYCQIPNFIRQVFTIILGIVITVGIGQIVEKKKNNSQIAVTLNLVKEELVSCEESLDNMIESMQTNLEGHKFFYANINIIDKIPVDTLFHYLNKCLIGVEGFTNFIAKDMLNKIAHYEEIDNDLVFEINHIYETLSLLGDKCDTYNNDTKTLIAEFENLTPLGGWGLNSSPYEIIKQVININIFRNRCNHTYNIKNLIALLQGVKEHFPPKIALFDEVLKNSNFDNFERPEQVVIEARAKSESRQE